MKLSELIKKLQHELEVHGDNDVEIQAYLNDVKRYGDRYAYFGLYPYEVGIEEHIVQVYCEDMELDWPAYLASKKQ